MATTATPPAGATPTKTAPTTTTQGEKRRDPDGDGGDDGGVVVQPPQQQQQQQQPSDGANPATSSQPQTTTTTMPLPRGVIPVPKFERVDYLARPKSVPDRIFTSSTINTELSLSPGPYVSERLYTAHVPPVPPDLKVGRIPKDPNERQRWVRPRKVQNPTARILAFANFGSSATVFKSWHKFLSEDLELLTLDNPGLGVMKAIEPYIDIKDLERSILPALRDPKFGVIQRPFCFYGQCIQGTFGSFFLANMMPRVLGLKPAHIFIGAAIPPHFPIPNLSDPETLSQVFRLPKRLTDKNPLMYKLATNYFSDYIAQKDFPPVDVPITVFRGTKDPFVTEEHCRQWARYTTATCDYAEIPGATHIYQHKEEFAKAACEVINAKMSVLYKNKPTIDNLANAFGFPTLTTHAPPPIDSSGFCAFF